MPCAEISSALSEFARCEETPLGARIATHCLYPSFEPVHVFVAKVGDEYRVHDGRGAFEAAQIHGRDVVTATHAIEHEAAYFHLRFLDCSVVANVSSSDWLESAILSVANASSLGANRAVARHLAAAEIALVDRIEETLSLTFGAKRYQRNFSARGKSGKEHQFDFAVRDGSEFSLLINGVAPHHSSIAAKYVAFADTDADMQFKFAVCDRELDTGDTALLQQVASIVPLASLAAGARRSLDHVG
ncbi:MAG: hypothetical protein E7774_11890 [Bradyrhizobium sp.]|nr:MAG: hypothetical protein E7774_11890 [Bradyrhizobium sp.]